MTVGQLLGDKLVLLVVAAGIASAIIVGLIKLGEVIVKRRTAALIAQHAEGADDEDGKDEPRSEG